MWYVNDVKIFHKRKTAVEGIQKTRNKLKVRLEASYGGTNDYLGMEINFLNNKRVAIGMQEYILAFEDIIKNAATPEKDNLFEVREDREVNPHLPEGKSKCFQSVVPLLLCKRCRLDIMLPVGFLCTRVKIPTEGRLVETEKSGVLFKRNHRQEAHHRGG